MLPLLMYAWFGRIQNSCSEDGDAVAVGDVVGLIEVMKSFHEVRSDVAGSNVRFVTDNEEPVMAGAVLAELD